MSAPGQEPPRVRPILSGDLQPAIIYLFLLIAAITHRHSVWGWLWLTLYGLLMLVAAWSTFSLKEYQGEEQRWPGLRRREYLLTMGIPYFALPVIGGLLVLKGWWLGVVVAVLPWLLLYTVGGLLARSKAS